MKGLARNPSGPQALPLYGEIRSTTIPNLFHDLSTAGRSGVLTVIDRDVRKTVQFAKGTVLFASSNDRDDRLNQILLTANALPLRDLLKALTLALSTKDRLGEVMVRMKMLSKPEVEKWVRHQVQEMIYTVFNWTRGQYSFDEKPAPEESITLGTPGDIVVLEGVRRISSWARVYEEVGGLNTEYRTTREMPAVVRSLPILKEEKALLDLCDEPMSLGELCEASTMSDHAVCKSVWALLILGALMKS